MWWGGLRQQQLPPTCRAILPSWPAFELVCGALCLTLSLQFSRLRRPHHINPSLPSLRPPNLQFFQKGAKPTEEDIQGLVQNFKAGACCWCWELQVRCMPVRCEGRLAARHGAGSLAGTGLMYRAAWLPHTTAAMEASRQSCGGTRALYLTAHSPHPTALLLPLLSPQDGFRLACLLASGLPPA